MSFLYALEVNPSTCYNSLQTMLRVQACMRLSISHCTNNDKSDYLLLHNTAFALFSVIMPPSALDMLSK